MFRLSSVICGLVRIGVKFINWQCKILSRLSKIARRCVDD